MEQLTVANAKQLAQTYLVPAGLDLVIGACVFFFGRWIARLVVRGASEVMERSGMEVSLRKFLADLLYAVLLVVVVTASLDRLGVHTTAVVAVLGAAGLAVGLALQGSLSNFAAGVMIIILRPYKVGDMVVIGKHVGRVEAIKVFHSILITADHREITMPNGPILAGTIENLTALGTRRIDIQVSVAHGTDLRQIKHLLENVARTDRRVLTEPAPAIDLAEVGNDWIKLYLRPWATVEDFGPVSADTVERIRETFEGAAIKYTVQAVSPA